MRGCSATLFLLLGWLPWLVPSDGLPLPWPGFFPQRPLSPLPGVLFLRGQMSVDQDLTSVSDVSSCFCPWWSSKEDTTSSISSGSPAGDPRSLCCLYTSRYKDWISSLLVWDLQAGWQIGLPQSPALVAPLDGLSRLFTPPLSILGLQHVGTFHRAS